MALCYSRAVTTTHTPRSALATESIWELHGLHYWIALAASSLIPAAVVALPFQWAAGPDFAGAVGLGRCFLILAMLFGLIMAFALPFWADQPGSRYLRRTLYRFAVFEHGAELRDGHGAVLGETANGTLRVTSINKWSGRQMVGAVRIEHRGGMLTLTPRNTVAPAPGQPATPDGGRWQTVTNTMYAQLLRFAS